MASSTLTGLLKQVAGQFPSRRAIQFDLTHARLQELIDQAASQLVASGVKPGDMVALIFPNTIEVFKPSPSRFLNLHHRGRRQFSYCFPSLLRLSPSS
ncbi:hypothetical protein C3L33_06456, partial [Rhododendron williamsianum]